MNKRKIKRLFLQFGKYPVISFSFRAGKQEDWPTFTKQLSRILMKTVSYYDLEGDDPNLLPEEKEEKRQENFYHGLMLGLMVYLPEEYKVESNRDYGDGRPDMIILPGENKSPAFVFEFKAVKMADKPTIEEAAAAALSQIRNKKYAGGLRAAGYGEVRAIGIGFKGKSLHTIIETRKC